MIKTHKPRGHLWTCPSLFQQSKEIRNISLEDCTPPAAPVLADSDDELQPKQRAAKRRRIESLADGFLNGQSLFISCVRPRPSALKGAIEGNERSRKAAKYALPEVELSDDDGEIWVDVLDVHDVAEKTVAVKARVRNMRERTNSNWKTTAATVETTTEEHATSACKPVLRIARAVRVSLEPSTEAVKQAAALRARRLQRVTTDLPRLPEMTSLDTINDSDNAGLQSEPDALPPRSLRSRKSHGTEWLLRRHTMLHRLNADESLDELSRSAIETPSRPSQLAPHLPAPKRITEQSSPDGSISTAATDACEKSDFPSRPKARMSFGAYREHWEAFDGSVGTNAGTALEDEASHARGSYHTAPEATEVEANTCSLPAEAREDSQTRLLRKQGINAAPRRSWTSTNGMQGPAQLADAGQVKGPSAEQHPQRASLAAYTKAEKQAENDTPFMFRKRTSRGTRSGSREDLEATASTKQRKAMKFLSSESEPVKKAAVTSTTPRLDDLSLGNDSFGNRLHQALTDEHLNAVLPTDPGMASAIRRAMRDEWRAEHTEIEISRINDEPASSQVEGLSEARKLSFTAINATMAGTTAGIAELVQTQWPGTQALLSKAHADFFHSPEKAGTAASPKANETPLISTTSTLGSVVREPLRTLSQEPLPLPSTQAMVEAWSPWSTVKKPKGSLARMETECRPVAKEIAVSAEQVASDVAGRRSCLRFSTSTVGSPTTSTTNVGGRRKSALRFSTSTTDSPTTHALPFTTTKIASQEARSQSSADRTVTAKSAMRKHSDFQSRTWDDGETMIAWDPPTIVPASAPATLDSLVDADSDAPMSSHQYGQRGLFRDDSNVDRTVADMESFLSLGDLDGVLSQSRSVGT
ncbi:hypothetical protein LTR53_004544 [Teratosphaeriaceae sp. CCFEE 6253]|nr:hypothetical protein LTR53_004544 [Teratosphaeriaceae sp. CCFEE 6253]